MLSVKESVKSTLSLVPENDRIKNLMIHLNSSSKYFFNFIRLTTVILRQNLIHSLVLHSKPARYFWHMSKVVFGCVDGKKGPYCFDVFRSRDQYMISFFEKRNARARERDRSVKRVWQDGVESVGVTFRPLPFSLFLLGSSLIPAITPPRIHGGRRRTSTRPSNDTTS